MTDERLRLIAEMKDRLTPALRRLKTVMDSTARGQAFRALARDMSFAEKAGYRLGFAMGTTLRWGAIGAAAAAGTAGAAFIKFGKQSADALDDQAAFAKQINFSADSLRTLQGVAKRYNVDQEQLRGGLQKFTTLYGRLQQGQGGFFTYLKKTNPALLEQFRHTKSGQEAFLLLSDAIAKTTDPAKRAALAKAAGLGQQFLRFFADGPDDLRKTIAEVIRLQGRLGPKAFQDAADYGDAMDNIGLSWEGLRDRLAASALPVVNPLLKDLADFVASNREGIVSGFKEIATDVGEALREFGTWASGLKAGDFRAFWAELKDGGAAIRDIAAGIKDLFAAIKEFGGWKAVIGAIIAYKAVGGVGGLAGALSGGGGSGAMALLALLTRFMPLVAVGGAAVAGSLWATKGIPKNLQTDPYSGLPFNAPPGYRPPPDNGRFFPEDRTTRARPSDIPTEAELRKQLAFEQYRADRLDADIRRWQKGGEDKADPEGFAAMTRQRFLALRSVAAIQTVLARMMRRNADEIGKKIGASAADSFIQRLGLAFARFGGSGGGGSGARVMRASYGGGGGGGRSFAGMGMLDLIANAEGTGKNYNTTLGYGALTGGPVNLTGMTLDQIDALQTRMLRHPGNRWNSSAVGRYQIVRTTLRNLRKRFGLPGSMTFSPALQDALARALVAGRGNSVGGMRNEWEGLRKVPNRVLEDAMREHRRARQPRQTFEGSASVDIRFPNGVPAGTRVGASGKGLFKTVNLDTGRAMKPAMA